MIFPWSLLKQKEEKKTPVQKKQEEEKVVADESGVGGIKKQTWLELESTKGWKSRWMVFAGKFFHWIWFFNIQSHEGGNSGDTLFWITFYRVDILIISCFFHFCNPKNHFCNESMFVYFPWFLVNQIFEFLFEWLLCFFKCFFFRFASVWSLNIRSRSFAHANSFGNQFPLGQFNWSHGLCHGQRSRRGRLRMVQPSLHRIWWLMSRPWHCC